MESIRVSINTSIGVSSIGGNCWGNSWGVDILEWAGDKDFMGVFSLLQLNKLSVSWSISLNGLKSSGLVLDFLGDGGWDSMDSSKPISSIQELGGTLGSDSESRENNLEIKA